MPKTGLSLKELIKLNEKMSPAQIAKYLTSLGTPITRQGICHQFKKAEYQPTRHPRTNKVDLKKVAELRRSGKEWQEIAKEMNIPMGSIGYRAKQANVGKITRQFTPPNEAKTFARLRVNGGDMSRQAMARELGVGLTTLVRWINRYKAKINGNNDVGTIQETKKEA